MKIFKVFKVSGQSLKLILNGEMVLFYNLINISCHGDFVLESKLKNVFFIHHHALH